jgi:hypothetical protein
MLRSFALEAAKAQNWPEAISQMQQSIQLCGDCPHAALLHKNLALFYRSTEESVTPKQNFSKPSLWTQTMTMPERRFLLCGAYGTHSPKINKLRPNAVAPNGLCASALVFRRLYGDALGPLTSRI